MTPASPARSLVMGPGTSFLAQASTPTAPGGRAGCSCVCGRQGLHTALTILSTWLLMCAHLGSPDAGLRKATAAVPQASPGPGVRRSGPGAVHCAAILAHQQGLEAVPVRHNARPRRLNAAALQRLGAGVASA